MAAVNVVRLNVPHTDAATPAQEVVQDDRRKVQYRRRHFRQRLDDMDYMALDAAARGVLESLEDRAAARGLLPNDPVKLAMLARLTAEDVRRALPRLIEAGYFVVCSGGTELHCPGVEAEIKWAVDIITKQSHGGKKGAAARYGKERDDKGDGSPMGPSSSSFVVCNGSLDTRERSGDGEGKNGGSNAVPSCPSDTLVAAPPCPADTIVTAYHEQLPMLPRVQRVTAGRREALQERWQEVWSKQAAAKGWTNADDVVKHFEDFFKFVRGCPFLVGEVVATKDGKPWFASFDWLMHEQRFWEVREGKYAPR